MSLPPTRSQQQIIVVGAGIVGASIAWHLARKGASVTVLATTPGGTATPNSFAWINASWGNPEFYFRFRRRSMAEWTRLAQDVPGLPLSWCGGLCWDLPRDGLEAYATEHSSWGYGIRRVGLPETRLIEPALREPPEFALHIAEEGAVEPAIAASMLMADAFRHGAAFFADVDIRGLIVRSGKVVGLETTTGVLTADRIVLAAGAGTAALGASAGIEIPIDSPPGLIVHSKPARSLLSGLVLAPELHMRQTTEGRIIAGSDFGGTDPGEDPDEAAAALFAKVQAMLSDGSDLELDFLTVGRRPTPRDGLPIIGQVGDMPGLYLAVMHSGVTLAPLVGVLAAAEIVDGIEDPALKPFRLARFD